MHWQVQITLKLTVLTCASKESLRFRVGSSIPTPRGEEIRVGGLRRPGRSVSAPVRMCVCAYARMRVCAYVRMCVCAYARMCHGM